VCVIEVGPHSTKMRQAQAKSDAVTRGYSYMEVSREGQDHD